MMQCRVVSKEDNYPVLLAGIRAARIDPVKHLKCVIDLPDGTQGTLVLSTTIREIRY
jgi:hypothetical protein